jgi:hypothetical protein
MTHLVREGQKPIRVCRAGEGEEAQAFGQTSLSKRSAFCSRRRDPQLGQKPRCLQLKERATHCTLCVLLAEPSDDQSPISTIIWQGFRTVGFHNCWKIECVEVLDGRGVVISIPLAWTDAAGADPFLLYSLGLHAIRVIGIDFWKFAHIRLP